MTKQETAKIIYIVMATYPRSYAKFGEKEISNLLLAWHTVLGDYDYDTASAGLKAYMVNDKNGFPPSPGQIIDHIHKLTESPEEKMTEGEAWRLVYKAVCNSIYNAAEEFERLPDTCQRAVGSPEILRQWAQEDIDSMSVIQSNFERAYRTCQDRRKEEKKIPESVKALVGQITNQLQITEAK